VLRGHVSRDPRVGSGTNGTWCFFSVKVARTRSTVYVDVGAFGHVAEDAGRLASGAAVTVHGSIASKKIRAEGKDGKVYDQWVPSLTADKIESVLAARGPGPAQASLGAPPADDDRPPPSDEDVPF